MIFKTNISGHSLMLEGKPYDIQAIEHLTPADHWSDFFQELLLFLKQWFSTCPTITIYSSGSTGTPKAITVEKQKMINSAIMTCQFLQLKTNDKALLCLPLSFIAGKMMVVRALVAGLDLYLEPPSGNPLQHHVTEFKLAAMVPLQVYNTLQHSSQTASLKRIQHVLIGGGAIDLDLQERLNKFPNRFYATYGMAETVSHIALHAINHPSQHIWYTPFDGVDLSLSDEQTLIIDAPQLASETIKTRDIARIRENGDFCILGRIDNVINSGGVKVQIEQVEAQLRPYMTGHFAIAAQSDAKFGQRIILLVEQKNIDHHIINQLPKIQRPKAVYLVDNIPLTHSNKIDRNKINQLILHNKLTHSINIT